MNSPILTIIVPTYNRSRCLEVLLRTLHQDVASLKNEVTVMVLDNCSHDDTPDVINRIKAEWPALQSHRHTKNTGAESNFLSGVRAVETKWFWIIGDDDLICSSLIKPVLNLLINEEPDMVYLPSHWTTKDLVTEAVDYQTENRQFICMNAEQLAAYTHVNLTFISSWIVKSTHLRLSDIASSLPKLMNTNLIQLSWILQALIHGQKFAVATDISIIASSGNTGGYKVLTVFGKNLPTILTDYLHDRDQLLIPVLQRLAWTYLPSLIWYSRHQKRGSFISEDYEDALIYWRYMWVYKILHKPLMIWPKGIAFFLLIFTKILDRWWSFRNRKMAKRQLTKS